AVGIVDRAGLIEHIPPDVSPEKLVSYPDTAAAQAAVDRGEIAGYYEIPGDFIERGAVSYFSSDNVQFTATDQAIKTLLVINLARADGEAAGRRVAVPAAFVEQTLPVTVQPPGVPDSFSLRDIGALISLFFLMTLLTGRIVETTMAQMARERDGRVLEVVLGAVSPFQLFAGKYIGLTLVGLFDIVLWIVQVWMMGGLGSEWYEMRSGQSLNMLEQITGTTGPLPGAATAFGGSIFESLLDSPQGIISLIGLILLGGYLTCMALAMVLGSLVNDPRQASRVEMLLVNSVSLSVLAAGGALVDRDGGWAVFLSLCPITSPVMMPVRLLVAQVQGWEIVLSFALLAGWAGLLVWASAKLFQAQLLLSTQPLTTLVWRGARRFMGLAASRSSSSARPRE
ncbi:MAG TPA: ABC transporter permease, partial [Anaerolineales bacterium]|nr:ABC transporter permease [Anaerolineales bacterium]